MCSGFDADL
uniref:Uncharacterized protein n=1 Tax=Arundo donax TaxID=35708 RepID=A0A0A9HH98_ARUDO